jgi:ribose transport system permease protein
VKTRAIIKDGFRKSSLIIIWAITIAVFTVLEPGRFLTVRTISGILGPQAALVVLSLGMLLPLVAGDYDLSVAGTLGLSAMTTAVLNVRLGMGIDESILVALAVGLVAGLFNGLVVVILGVDSLVATLGLGTVEQGLILWIANGQTITGVSGGIVTLLVSDTLFNISLEFYLTLAACVIVWCLLEVTRFGKQARFIGHGRDVARLNGVPVSRIRIGMFIGAGVTASVAGVLFMGTTGSADPTSASSLLLPAFAAAFLSSTVIKPGRSNAIGTMIAVYFLVTGVSGLEILGAPLFVSYVFYGFALIIAVLISRRGWLLGRRERTLRLRADDAVQ